MQGSYRQTYSRWKDDPEAFWREAAAEISSFKPPEQTFSREGGPYGRWFAGGETNTCYNCLDRHVLAGRGDDTAFIYDSPISGTKAVFTYGDVLAEVTAIAGTLRQRGIAKGDRVIIY